MFFLFKYVDDLIGKGFEWYTILELMLYQAAISVAMALPLSILLSSIMTFGSLGENYELVAIKSAGISLQKAMRPLFLVIITLAIGSFFFSQYIMPKANMKFWSLMYDIKNAKLSFLIKPGIFNNSITSYAIRVDSKSEDGSLYGIVIYDHTSNNGIAKVIMAKEGKMTKSPDGNFMTLKLLNGIRYEETNGNGNGSFNPRQELYRMRFKETEVRFDFSSFHGLSRTSEDNFRGNTVMLNLKELKHRKDSLTSVLDSVNKTTKFNVNSYYKQTNYVKGYTKIKTKPIIIKGAILKTIPQIAKMQAVQNGIDQAESIKQVLENRVLDFDAKKSEITNITIEYQKKYTLTFSCLLLFFIGAPLGAIIRKGGLGMPVVIAVFFFLIYHIISTVAEKSAKEGSLDPVIGTWMAIIILTPVGIFLTYKATVDSALFDLDFYKQRIVKFFLSKKN